MYFESVFIKPNNFYINIYNTNKKNSWSNTLFLASKEGRPLKEITTRTYCTHQDLINKYTLHNR